MGVSCSIYFTLPREESGEGEVKVRVTPLPPESLRVALT